MNFNRLRSIGSYGFCACVTLSVVILNNVESVGSDAFSYCWSLRYVEMNKLVVIP